MGKIGQDDTCSVPPLPTIGSSAQLAGLGRLQAAVAVYVCVFLFFTRHVDQMVKSKASKPSWMWSCRSWACGPPGPQWLIIYPLKDRYRWPSPSSSLLWFLLIIFLPFPFPLLGLSPNTPPLHLLSFFLFPRVFVHLSFSSSYFCLPSSSLPFHLYIPAPVSSPHPQH